jgi:predicted nucleic acid-binding protein
MQSCPTISLVPERLHRVHSRRPYRRWDRRGGRCQRRRQRKPFRQSARNTYGDGHRAVTSTITMTELLVQPYRAGDEQRVDEFYGLLATYPNLDWIAPDLEIADMAARIRAMHGLRTPDALQAAIAVRSHVTGFVTNDPVFERIDSFETLVLDRVL